jgi:hypothetical protein
MKGNLVKLGIYKASFQMETTNVASIGLGGDSPRCRFL